MQAGTLGPLMPSRHIAKGDGARPYRRRSSASQSDRGHAVVGARLHRRCSDRPNGSRGSRPARGVGRLPGLCGAGPESSAARRLVTSEGRVRSDQSIWSHRTRQPVEQLPMMDRCYRQPPGLEGRARRLRRRWTHRCSSRRRR